jgi:hypothetical protein
MVDVLTPTRASHDSGGHLTAWRRVMPALGLLFLAPLVAEYLLGNLPITALVLLVPL